MTIDNSTIENLVTAPERTRTEEGTVVERGVKDLVLGDQYTRTRTATSAVPWGMRMARIKAGSTTPGGGGT